MSSERISRDELFMSIARLFGMRSSCPRAEVGVIAVTEGRVTASGYVGAPTGQPHCDEVGCLIKNDHCVRTTHAEANMISWAAREGLSLFDSTIYCTHKPCYSCAKLIGNLGIEQLVYAVDYDNQDEDLGIMLLQELGVEVRQYGAVES